MASLAKSSTARLTSSRAQRCSVARSCRVVTVKAKYGDQSKYFDLKDLENTTGSWDMYGVDDPKRYPGMQEQFFRNATDIVSRREALNAFVALAGVGAIAAFGALGAKQANLPITLGPREGKTENGKGGSVRSRL